MASASTVARPGKHLTFRLAAEEYGIDIRTVQEIVGIMPITRVPRTPASVRGVVNLRGRVIPVVDLRVTFGVTSAEDTERTCIVVVGVRGKSGPAVMGVVVDEVSEVVDIAAEHVEATPEFGSDVHTDFVTGIGTLEERVVMLLDIDTVLSGREHSAIRRLTEECQAETGSPRKGSKK